MLCHAWTSQHHPGGARVLLKASGGDGTALFLKHHPWVDADYLLGKRAVGWLRRPEPSISEDGPVSDDPPGSALEPASQQGADQ